MCPAAAEAMIATALNISRAEVRGVVSFYHDFPPRAGRPPRAEDLPRRGVPNRSGGIGLAQRAAGPAGPRLGRHHRRRQRDHRRRLLPGPVLLRTRGHAGRSAAGSAGRRRPGRGGANSRCSGFDGRTHDPGLSARRHGLPGAGLGAGAARAAGGGGAARARRWRWCAPGRAARLGWSRWSRWRPRRPHRLWAGAGTPMSPACWMRACWRAATHRAADRGPPDQHPWFAGQTRLTFARCGVIDPVFGGGLPCPWRLTTGSARALELG